MTIIQKKRVQPFGLVVCFSCHGTGYVVYIAVGDEGISSHHRPCNFCDSFGYVAPGGAK